MFPLRDDNPTELVPFVTFALITACVAAWVFVQGAGADQEAYMASICTLGTLPAELSAAPVEAQADGCALGGYTWATLLTSMFMHGSWMHLIGNMWFLWIFGNNIEDSMGHGRFLFFYVATGVLASTAHVFSEPSSVIPTVGASGAISGILGAYAMLYPRARVQTLIFIKLFWVPAALFLAIWFTMQLISSFIPQPAGGGGVAFAAHIGGFLAGLMLIGLFANRQLVDAKHKGIVLPRKEIRGGGWW